MDRARAASSSGMPAGALGLWLMDQYQAAPYAAVPNKMSTQPLQASLYRTSRALQVSPSVGASGTVTKNAAAAPDGATTATRYVLASGNYLSFTCSGLPSGTYTVAAWVKRGGASDQNFGWWLSGASPAQVNLTATSTWQRFTRTVTLSSGSDFRLGGTANLVNAADLLIWGAELFSGSSDLHPNYTDMETPGGHCYFGSTAYAPSLSVSSGSLDLSGGGNSVGHIQFASPLTVSTFTVIAIGSKIASNTNFDPILTAPGNPDYTNFAASYEFTNAPSGYFGGSDRVSGNSQGWLFLNRGFKDFVFRYDGSKFDLQVDGGVMVSSTASVSAQTLQQFYLNALLGTNNSSKYKFAAVAFYDKALTNKELDQATAYLWTYVKAAGVTQGTHRFLCAEGDSITSAGSAYWVQFLPNCNPLLYARGNAVSGSTIAFLNSRAATVDAYLPRDMTNKKCILSVLIGTNDLGSYSSTANWITDAKAYCSARRAAGWKVVMATLLPRTGDATYTSRRPTVNSDILANWVTAGAIDAVMDFGGDATMGPDAAASNATYYSDGVHPTTSGHTVLEPIYRAAINAI